MDYESKITEHLDVIERCSILTNGRRALLAGLPDANSLRKPEVVRSARFNATYIGNDEWLIQTLFDPIERKSPRLSFDRWVLNERTGQAVQYGGDRQQVEAFCPRTR